MINGLTKYLTLDGTDLSFVFSPGTTSTKSGYLLSDGITDLSDIFASKDANAANITGYKYISAGIERDINNLYEKLTLFSVSFNIPTDSQFTIQTTTDELYDVYTIIGQTATDGAALTTWADKTVVATFMAKTTKTIYYVCIGGGGYTYCTSSASCGGAGAGAYFEGSINISTDVSFNFTAGGSYKTSTITSTLLNITAGRGGKSIALSPSESGINGSSGGGGGANASAATSPGSGSSPGNAGGTALFGNSASRSGGGGGGAGGQGGNASNGQGGQGGSGKIPSAGMLGIKNVYTTALCVGGGGNSGNVAIGATSTTYGSGAGGRREDTFYRYGRPGAIIIAIPKT